MNAHMSAARAIVLGTLVVGVLDAADALIFFGLRGATPIRIFQSIAAGLLGRPAFAGGLATAALGVVLHFFIAGVIVSVAVFAARRLRLLTRAPILTGLGYGVGVYIVMNYVVLPLSNAGAGKPSGVVLLNGVLIHMFGVGLPGMLFARSAAESDLVASGFSGKIDSSTETSA